MCCLILLCETWPCLAFRFILGCRKLAVENSHKTVALAATWQLAAVWLDRFAPQTRCGGCSVAHSVVYTQTSNKQGWSGEAQTVYDTGAFVVPFDRLWSLIFPARSLFWFPSRWVKHPEWRVNQTNPTWCVWHSLPELACSPSIGCAAKYESGSKIWPRGCKSRLMRCFGDTSHRANKTWFNVNLKKDKSKVTGKYMSLKLHTI